MLLHPTMVYSLADAVWVDGEVGSDSTNPNPYPYPNPNFFNPNPNPNPNPGGSLPRAGPRQSAPGPTAAGFEGG